LIFELAASCFAKAATEPSIELVERVPKQIPSIFEDSITSKQARTAYVSHLISTILVERVFTPFLFGLGTRCDETADILAKVSDRIRVRSALREATWRQHTLLAAYTTTDAKARMNQEAGKVVDEIMEAIMPLYVEGDIQRDEVRQKIRNIVKLAVETWRYARLEREKIEAFMPTYGEESLREDAWKPFRLGVLDDDLSGGVERRNDVILSTFPLIRREPVQEAFWIIENDKNDRGCLYSSGYALYSE
jgi:hypothetical protein